MCLESMADLYVKNEDGELVRPTSEQLYHASRMELRHTFFYHGADCSDIENLKSAMRQKYSFLDLMLYTVLFIDEDDSLIVGQDMIELNIREVADFGFSRKAHGLIVVKNDPCNMDENVSENQIREEFKVFEQLEMPVKSYLRVVGSDVHILKLA